MAWVAVGAAATSAVIGGVMSKGKSQGGTQTVNKDPWAPAQDWMKANLQTGQNLQSYYGANPFNAQQQSAYGNLASGNDYLNRVTPGLLQQMSQPTGFDRNNPTARPSPLNFAAAAQSPQMSQMYGGQMQQAMPQSFAQSAAAAPMPKPQGAFDAGAYLAANPDVAQNAYWSQRPLDHYNQHGKGEGRAYTTMGA